VIAVVKFRRQLILLNRRHISAAAIDLYGNGITLDVVKHINPRVFAHSYSAGNQCA
jgi:hypothetical protein